MSRRHSSSDINSQLRHSVQENPGYKRKHKSTYVKLEVQVFSQSPAKMSSASCNNRYPSVALPDANYFNGTPIRVYHESISVRCNGSYLHNHEEQCERTDRLKPGQNEALRSDRPHPAIACFCILKRM